VGLLLLVVLLRRRRRPALRCSRGAEKSPAVLPADSSSEVLGLLHIGLPGCWDVKLTATLHQMFKIDCKAFTQPSYAVQRTACQCCSVKHVQLHSVTLNDCHMVVSLIGMLAYAGTMSRLECRLAIGSPACPVLLLP